jgi:hypothetical protein
MRGSILHLLMRIEEIFVVGVSRFRWRFRNTLGYMKLDGIFGKAFVRTTTLVSF